MEQMTIEELEKNLNKWENETIIFDLTGLVSRHILRIVLNTRNKNRENKSDINTRRYYNKK